MSDSTPAQVEASGDTTDVEYGGQSYQFPSTLDEASGDVLDAIDDMKLSHALQGLMAEGEWQRFKQTGPKVKDYGALFDAYAKRIGLGSAGE